MGCLNDSRCSIYQFRIFVICNSIRSYSKLNAINVVMLSLEALNSIRLFLSVVISKTDF